MISLSLHCIAGGKRNTKTLSTEPRSSLRAHGIQAVQVPVSDCGCSCPQLDIASSPSHSHRDGARARTQKHPPSPLMWTSGFLGLAVLKLWSIGSLFGQFWMCLYISARLEDTLLRQEAQTHLLPRSHALGTQLKRRCICCHFHLLSPEPG